MSGKMDSNTEIVITLYEGHYHYGVAALVNSLYKSGFHGVVRVGYRGALPAWISQLTKINDTDYSLHDSIVLSFVFLETDMHFAYYKPFFFKETLAAFPEVQRLYYFDPDIVVNAPWSFFSAWPEMGVALCLDNCYSFLHVNHPWRNEWMKLTGSSPRNNCDYYVNTGFIGFKRADIIIASRWADITTKFSATGGDVKKFHKSGHNAIKTDQDLLNAIINVSPDINFSVIGKEGMGFTQPAYLMSHAVSDVKPWKKNHLKDLFRRGNRPSLMDKSYLAFSNFPIRSYGSVSLKLKQINLRAAVVLGRLIGK
jgi:hypothetical protein